MSDRDVQRSKMYAAEIAVRDSYPGRSFEHGDLDEVQAYVDKLIGEAWFKRRYRKRSIEVRAQSHHRLPSAGWGKVTMPMGDRAKWAWCEQVVLHEVAHCIVGPYGDGGWHGRSFARVYLELVRHRMGDEAWRSLRDSFRKHGVKWHPRRELTEEQRSAAAERLRLYREAATT